MWAAAPRCSRPPSPKAITLSPVPVVEKPATLTPLALARQSFWLLSPWAPSSQPRGLPWGQAKSKGESPSNPSVLSQDLQSMQALWYRSLRSGLGCSKDI